jgi:hypothetical protein
MTYRLLSAPLLLSALFAVPDVAAANPTSVPPTDRLEQVLRWSIGPGDRLPTGDADKPIATGPAVPPSKPDSDKSKEKTTNQLLLVSLKSGKRLKEVEVGQAVSFLPSNSNPEWVYLAANGQLQKLDTSQGTLTAVPSASDLPAGLQLHRLLAIAANEELLVEGSLPGQATHSLWQLSWRQGQVSGSPVARERIQDRASFFASFRVPRCQTSDRSCLVSKQTGKRSYLLKESVVDSDEQKLVKDLTPLGCRQLYGASWASADAAYVLGACRNDQLL